MLVCSMFLFPPPPTVHLNSWIQISTLTYMPIFSFRVVKINNHLNVRKVSSGFEYFLLIFAGETVLPVQLVVLDAEFDPASSDGIFEGGGCGWGYDDEGDGQRHPDSHSYSHPHPHSSLTLTPTPLKNPITRRKIKFCMEHNQLDSQHSFTSEYQQAILESAANFSYVSFNLKWIIVLTKDLTFFYL